MVLYLFENIKLNAESGCRRFQQHLLCTKFFKIQLLHSVSEKISEFTELNRCSGLPTVDNHQEADESGCRFLHYFADSGHHAV